MMGHSTTASPLMTTQPLPRSQGKKKERKERGVSPATAHNVFAGVSTSGTLAPSLVTVRPVRSPSARR